MTDVVVPWRREARRPSKWRPALFALGVIAATIVVAVLSFALTQTLSGSIG